MQLGDHSHLRRWTKTVSGAYVWNTLSLSLSLPSLLPFFLPSFFLSLYSSVLSSFLSFFPLSLSFSLSLSRCLNVKWVDGWIVEFTVTWLIFTPHWNFHVLEKIHPTQLGYHWCVATASQEMIRCFPSLRLQVRWKNYWCFAVQMGGFIQHFQPPKKRWLSKVSIFLNRWNRPSLGNWQAHTVLIDAYAKLGDLDNAEKWMKPMDEGQEWTGTQVLKKELLN